MPAELADRLQLPLMVTDNRDPLRTAYLHGDPRIVERVIRQARRKFQEK
jgi:hypothetical protein